MLEYMQRTLSTLVREMIAIIFASDSSRDSLRTTYVAIAASDL